MAVLKPLSPEGDLKITTPAYPIITTSKQDNALVKQVPVGAGGMPISEETKKAIAAAAAAAGQDQGFSINSIEDLKSLLNMDNLRMLIARMPWWGWGVALAGVAGVGYAGYRGYQYLTERSASGRATSGRSSSRKSNKKKLNGPAPAVEIS